jgi:LmbE family N-acetylglucosaminyl deacetylase
LTSGEAGGHGDAPEETRRVREGEARAAGRLLGVDDIEFWREPDGRLEVRHESVIRLARRIASLQPRLVYVTHPDEAHPDHRAAARLVGTALLHLDRDLPRPDVLMYEVWTPLQQLDEIVDITPFAETKKLAIRAHATQCAHVAFDDAILGLNRYRGEMHCWPEGEYAEVFQCMRVDDAPPRDSDARADLSAEPSRSATSARERR